MPYQKGGLYERRSSDRLIGGAVKPVCNHGGESKKCRPACAIPKKAVFMRDGRLTDSLAGRENRFSTMVDRKNCRPACAIPIKAVLMRDGRLTDSWAGCEKPASTVAESNPSHVKMSSRFLLADARDSMRKSHSRLMTGYSASARSPRRISTV